ncbi:MAG: 50S ribosomal protein L22 [Candidatus Margulisbacteria bacterium]|nr:50S ribosomal protein L22 [Candidatus Margulisiibacteriota bacterium]
MTKQVKIKVNKEETFANSKYLRISPYKVRRVANVIRGEQVTKAMSILNSLPQKAAFFLSRALKSAVANAVVKKMSPDNLVVSTLMVNEGSMFKRHQPRARGRMFQILKRTSHISIGVCEGRGL